VRNLGVSHIVVLGHAQCGGIRALMQAGNTANSFIGDWMQLAAEARIGVEHELSNATPEARLRNCEQRSILISIRNLMTFPWVRERVERGELKLHGWYFDIEQGQLLHYDETTRAFAPL
jgi:carbonic anhydrase